MAQSADLNFGSKDKAHSWVEDLFKEQHLQEKFDDEGVQTVTSKEQVSKTSCSAFSDQINVF